MSTTPVEQTPQPQPNHDASPGPDHSDQLDRDVRDLGTLMAMDWGLRNFVEPEQKRKRGPKR